MFLLLCFFSPDKWRCRSVKWSVMCGKYDYPCVLPGGRCLWRSPSSEVGLIGWKIVFLYWPRWLIDWLKDCGAQASSARRWKGDSAKQPAGHMWFHSGQVTGEGLGGEMPIHSPKIWIVFASSINSTSSISMNGQPEMSQTRMSFPPSSFRDFHWPWSVRADPWWPLFVMAHRHKRPPFSQNPQNLQTFSQICPIRTIWDLLGNNQESEGLLMRFRLFIIVTLRGIAFHNSHPERTPQKCKCIWI